MKKIIVAMLAISILLVGCGQSHQEISPTTSPGTHFHHGLANSTWVSSWSVGKPREFYVISSEKVKNVVKRISSSYTDGSAKWASADEDVIEIWSIADVDISKAVAVKLKNGTFLKANAVGTKQPS